MKNEHGLGKSGLALLDGLENDFDLGSVMPAAVELARVADRLSEVRGILKQSGLMLGTKRHPLCDTEGKLMAQYVALWKVCGFADPDTPARPVGRPSTAERAKRG
jgi:hypothetical protein